MPQQTKTEALEELARLIRRDIMNGTARLNETWWFDDDTRMQDRIAHVLLDYSDDDDVLKGYAERCVLLREQKQASEDIAAAIIDDLNKQIDALNEKCAALVVERDHIKAQFATAFGEQRERAFDKMAKPLVEEQGPWVVMREVRGGFHYYTDPTVDDWGTSLHEAKQFDSKLTADVIAAETTKNYRSKWFVRTVDEAGGQ